MQVKYFNSNFDNNQSANFFDKKIIDTIKNFPAFNIIFNENLLIKTLSITKEFKLNKKKIILFGTGGSNLGARALLMQLIKLK